MKLILHIIAKDFLFLRGRLAAWLAVMVVKFAIGFWFVLGADVSDKAVTNIMGGVTGMIVVDAALTLLLAALLVQEDAVAGSAAFWRTRPIAGRRLLAAKLCGASLLLVVPALVVALPWWLVCGLTPRQFGFAALEVVLFQGALLAVAFTAASVTDSLGRCFVWGLVGVAATQGIAGVWGFWWPKWFKVSPPGEMIPLYAVLALLVMLGVIAWQYLTRRTKVARAILLVSAVAITPAASVVGKRVTPYLAAANPSRGEENPELSRGIDLGWESAGVRLFGGNRRIGYVNFRYELRGVPPGYLVNGGGARHELRWSGGLEIPVLQSSVGGESIANIAAKLVQGSGELSRDRTRTVRVWSSVGVDKDLVPRMQAEPVDLKATLGFQLVRPEVVQVMPAEPGPWRARLGRGLRVVRLVQVNDEPQAVVMESEPLGGLETAWGELRGRRMSRQNFLYVVQRLDEGFSTSRFGRSFSGMALGGVQLRRRWIEVHTATSKSERETAPSGTAKTNLVLVDLSNWATFHRQVELPRLQPK